ncbi:MAG: sugar transferase, partial [Blautia sp.]|nr:sugar transferase [Blautia sp.]
MKQRRFDNIKNTIRKLEGVLEIALLTIIYFLIWKYCYRLKSFPTYYGKGKYVLAGVYFVILYILLYYSEGLKFGYLKLTDVLISQWISVIIANAITYFQLCLIANKMINALPMLAFTGIGVIVTLVCTYTFTRVYHTLNHSRRMLMIYGNINAVPLKVKMDQRADKYQIEDLISASEDMGKLKEAILQYDAVVVSDIPAQKRNDILKFCYQKGIRAYVTPKISDVMIRGANSIHLFDTPLLRIKPNGLNYEQRFFKRILDLVICSVALLLTWPIMLIVAVAIKLEDGGPVFFKQRRVTRYNREFEILKFRSMIVDAEKEGIAIPAKDHDPRITKVGRFIRATRIDELPQIINILKNDMSIVGPRPERVEHVKEYCELIPEFEFRTKVKGGLTGYAQIYGKYNTSAYDKLKLDLMYIENYSIILDLKL